MVSIIAVPLLQRPARPLVWKRPIVSYGEDLIFGISHSHNPAAYFDILATRIVASYTKYANYSLD